MTDQLTITVSGPQGSRNTSLAHQIIRALCSRPGDYVPHDRDEVLASLFGAVDGMAGGLDIGVLRNSGASVVIRTQDEADGGSANTVKTGGSLRDDVAVNLLRELHALEKRLARRLASPGTPQRDLHDRIEAFLNAEHRRFAVGDRVFVPAFDENHDDPTGVVRLVEDDGAVVVRRDDDDVLFVYSRCELTAVVDLYANINNFGPKTA